MPRTEKSSKLTNYQGELTNRYWTYQQLFFPQIETYFERPFVSGRRPPVFLNHQARHNLLTKPDASPEEINRLLALFPPAARHKWFRSMNSSQALAQSVLGNLAIYNYLACLTELRDDAGEPLLGEARVSSENFVMEYPVNHLGEPRPTSLDAFVSGAYQVAIECKFTEAEVGPCSRPSLKPSASNYNTDWCNGTFTWQLSRRERCSLTEVGVLYWTYIPKLFEWPNNIDLIPCPLHRNYQLVRNILAACIRPEGAISPENGHVILIYDDRNPAFQVDGNGFSAFVETQQALKVAGLLRKCSWQRLVRHLKKEDVLPWLTEQLELKYGLK